MAVATRPPDLEPICIFDSDSAVCRRWLERHDVTVVRWRLSFADAVRRCYPNRPDVACGAFLRCDIPLVCDQLGIADPFVLYTDCDVMFCGGLVYRDGTCDGFTDWLSIINPPYLAAAPELDPNDWSYFNSGVMVLNRERFGAEMPRMVESLESIYPETDFDQRQLNRHFAGRWSWLPVEYNHKPYWGVNRQARICHFHGPKPNAAPKELPPEIAGGINYDVELRRGGFDYYSAMWRHHHEQIRDRSSAG